MSAESIRRWLTTAALSALALAATVAVFRPTTGQANKGVLVGTELHLMDSGGNLQVRVFAEGEKGAGLLLKNASGSAVVINAEPTAATALLAGPDGLGVAISAGGSTDTVQVTSPDAKSALALKMKDGSPFLLMYDEAGRGWEMGPSGVVETAK